MSEERNQQCLTSCANWMSQLPEGLWDTPLWDLAIPGSHDTMTYCLDPHSPVLKSEPMVLRALDRIVPCIIRSCMNKWGTTQDMVISNQLEAGIRFLDLRVAHKKNDPANMLYFAHGIYTLQTVKEALLEVVQWLKKHPKEVVLIALSAFDGFNSNKHKLFIHFLKRLFEKKLCPNSDKPSLRSCWHQGHQVLLSYDDSSAAGHVELWPTWDYWWADETDPRQVVSYLELKKKGGRPAVFFMAGLNLTEDASYVIFHPCQSMRSMTERAYPLLLDWLKDQQPGSAKTCLNVICADFVGMWSYEFAQLVIALNNRLLRTDITAKNTSLEF